MMKLKKAAMLIFMACIVLASLLAIPSVAAQPAAKIRVMVGFRGKPDPDLIRAYDGTIRYEYKIIPAIACSLPEIFDALKNDPRIAYIELDGKVRVMREQLPWGVDRIDAEIVHGYNKGTGIKIAVIDTGIDYDHPDLIDNVAGGESFVDYTTDYMDDHGHGTHVAGIIAAEDNEIGVIGVAPEADLYALKALDSGGSGYVSDVVAAIDWAVANGMQIISMSLGSNSDNQALHDACDKAYNAGTLLVAAAGNDYRRWGSFESDTIDYPARYSSVIAVGATDNTDTKASWSSTGSALELAAPGVSIYSTYWDDTYGTLSGTSMACPHVAGTAALVWAGEPTLTNVEVRTRLQETADDLGSSGKDKWYGYGLVDADEAAPGVDTTPPVISAVASLDITTSSATITWTTDEPSDSVVNYGTTITLGSTASDVTMVTSHSITLTGLAAGTTYYYEVKATDSAGNTAVDNNGGLYYTFMTLAPDTTPPSTITDLTATAGTYPDIHLDWTAATDNVGVDHYNIYRSTTGTIDRATDLLATAAGTATSYTDSTGTAETTYYYAVCAVDAAGNEADLSNIEEATVAAAPSNTMHVESIVMSKETRWFSKRAVAVITILDADGNPVEGATVYGTWSGLTTESESGVTGSDGKVTFYTNWIWRGSGTCTFTVTDVEKTGWTYDSGANKETSDSITI